MPVSPQHRTLAPGLVELFVFEQFFAEAEILNRDGAAEVWYTFDGSIPQIGEDGTYVLPAAISSQTFHPPRDAGNLLVKATATAPVQVTVAGVSGV